MKGEGRRGAFEFFEEKYARPRTPTSRQMERAALGHDAGLNGYTTVEQAQVLCDWLALTPKCTLLDVGAGFGWPGSHIARTCHCHLFSTEVPWDALHEAKRVADSPEYQTLHEVIGADGRALPLRPCSVDAIVHADVFC